MKKWFSLLSLVLGVVLIVTSFGPVRASSYVVTEKTIEAKALTDHECDSIEWHFVITQIEPDESTAPIAIYVTWANGASAEVPLEKYTGKTAHYTTYDNLGSSVTSATALIYESWSGEFNLSHGPCGTPPTVNTASLKVINSCSGGKIEVTASAGATYTEPVWTWSLPYVLEEVPGGSVTVNWSTGTPLSMTLPYDKVTEPAECLVVLPHSYRVNVKNSCQGYDWVVLVDQGSYVASSALSGVWKDVYIQETSPSPSIEVTWNDGYKATYQLPVIIEPAECLVVDGHEFLITPVVDCKGFGWSVFVKNGIYETYDTLSGVWTNKYLKETSPNPSVKISWADGYTTSLRLNAIEEPLSCVIDQPTPMPTSTPVPQKTGAGSTSSPLGTFVLGLGLMLFGGLGLTTKKK